MFKVRRNLKTPSIYFCEQSSPSQESCSPLLLVQQQQACLCKLPGIGVHKITAHPFVNRQGRLWCQGHTHLPAPLQEEWEMLNYLNLALRGASTSQIQSCQMNVPWDVSLHIGVTSLAGSVRLKLWELPVSSPAAHSSCPSPSPALGGSSCLITELEATMRKGASMS